MLREVLPMRERRKKYLKNVAGIDIAFEENISENEVFNNIAINNSFNYENWMTGNRVGHMQVVIHVNGTGKAYPVTVNLTKNKVIEVGEYAWQEK